MIESYTNAGTILNCERVNSMHQIITILLIVNSSDAIMTI